MDTDSDETIYPQRGGRQSVDSGDEDSITQRSSSPSSDEAAAVEDIINKQAGAQIGARMWYAFTISPVERPLDPRILPVYRQCWEEFYQDEQAYCLDVLRGLSRGGELGDGAELEYLSDVDEDERMLVDGVSPLNGFSVVEAADGEHSYIETESVEVPSMTPWPVYYSCAPAHTYFRLNVGSRNAVLQYIRHDGVRHSGNTPGFDERVYMSKYRGIGWQAPFQDPDCEHCRVCGRLH